jgi:anti-anti-sigma factor
VSSVIGSDAPPSEPAVVAGPLGVRTWLVELSGECDLCCAEAVRAEIERGLALGHRHVLVDLSAATLLDCTILGVLLSAVSSLRHDPEAAVALAGLCGPVARFLDIVHIRELFDVYDDRSDALDALDHDGGGPRRQGWKAITDERPSPLLAALGPGAAASRRANDDERR